MTNTPVLSLVSGTYNRLPTLQRMLASVRRSVPYSIPLEFIVADNGSSDGTGDWIESQNHIRMLQLGQPVGAIKAFTAAAREARGKYVLLATDDCHFPPLAIMRAIRHLEETPDCGAVAFGHNKYLQQDGYEVMVHPAHDENDQPMAVVYPQIAMIRRWLGEECGWWGGDHPVMSQAFTYGGDDFLGAGIWERGYTVDSVEGVYELEDVIQDAPRQMNEAQHQHDAELYWSMYQRQIGHLVRSSPIRVNPDRRQMRVLCALQYNPNLPQHRQNKKSWLGAWENVGLVYDYDYMGRHAQGAKIASELAEIAYSWQPDVIFTQVHKVQRAFDLDTAHHLRNAAPGAMMINWNGDYWPGNYLAADMIELLRYYDLQLVQNAWVVEPYCEQGVCAAYIPHSFEPVAKLPSAPHHAAVFVGNGYNQWRRDFAAQLDQWGVSIYGGFNNVRTQGSTQYDFAQTRALYHNAKVAISPMQFTEEVYGFVSNRLWEILAAGGALCLQQHSPGLDELSGLRAGEHYVEWRTMDELHDLVSYYTDPAQEMLRKQIAQAGYREALARHSFDARLDHLVQDLLTQVVNA